MKDYLNANRELWNKRVDVHLESELYDVAAFKKGKTSLQSIELEQLGDIRGKKLLHLQCHFGQDTISLGRMGGRVTGVDLSDTAINKARELAEELEVDARFICCDIFELDQHLEETFDIVFTTYGTIGWLPELQSWGRIVSHFLKLGGVFHFVEFHPVVWMFDDNFSKFEYSYFNKAPIVEELTGTYTDRNAPIKNLSYSWNHPLGDVFQALLSNGLHIGQFREFDFSPYDCFSNTVKVENGYQIRGLEGKIPMVYALKATKGKG